MTRASLSGGTIGVIDTAQINATGDLKLLSGSDISVQASAGLGADRCDAHSHHQPNSTTISIITGQRQIQNGFILVPDVKWVATQVVDQVGTENIRIGNIFHTLEVTLTQDAYYNANAPANARLREYFIENIDYYNDFVAPSNFLAKEISHLWSAGH